jgi:16S rRNA (guanine(966)-N(2))-methyltransferase RsmD
MRIISGELGGRRITPPSKMPHTRPTTDLAREGLFNVLQNNLDFTGLKTLELFSGTGAISYELGSRGATDQTVVEKDAQMYVFIKKTAEMLGLSFKVHKLDAFKYIDQCTEQFDFIFADPPYAMPTMDELPLRIFAKGLLKPGGWLVLEHTTHNNYDDHPNFDRKKTYGTTIFSVFIQP